MVPYKMSNFLFRLFVWTTMDSASNRVKYMLSFGSGTDQTLPLLIKKSKIVLNAKIQPELRNFRI